MRRFLKVNIKPELIKWACTRCERGNELNQHLKSLLNKWKNGEDQPTYNQLKALAKATYTPIGYFFLDQVPSDNRTLPEGMIDMRTLNSSGVSTPSLNLLDTIYLCQRRQSWFREHTISENLKPVTFVGAGNIQEDSKKVAKRMRNLFEIENISANKEDYLRSLKRKIEAKGIMVMSDTRVANSNNRKLEVKEFRGFALSDKYAPLIFINKKDHNHAQLFTLVHELAHIHLGKTSIVDTALDSFPNKNIEVWCNKVAGNFLVPSESLRDKIKQGKDIISQVFNIAKEM